MSGFLDGSSLGNVTQKHVVIQVQRICLLLCMYRSFKERSSMVPCLVSKVDGVSYRNAKLCVFTILISD